MQILNFNPLKLKEYPTVRKRSRFEPRVICNEKMQSIDEKH